MTPSQSGLSDFSFKTSTMRLAGPLILMFSLLIPSTLRPGPAPVFSSVPLSLTHSSWPLSPPSWTSFLLIIASSRLLLPETAAILLPFCWLLAAPSHFFRIATLFMLLLCVYKEATIDATVDQAEILDVCTQQGPARRENFQMCLRG